MYFLYISYAMICLTFACNGMGPKDLATALEFCDKSGFIIHSGNSSKAAKETEKECLAKYITLAKEVFKETDTVIIPTRQDLLSLQNLELKTLYYFPFHVQPSRLPLSYVIIVNIAHNKLTDLPLDILCDKMPNLEELWARNNDIAYMSLGWKKTNSKLRVLDLQHNKLRTLDFERLTVYFPNLKELDVSHNIITKVIMRSKRNVGMIDDHLSHEWYKIDMSNNLLSFEYVKKIKNKYIANLKIQLKQQRSQDSDQIIKIIICLATLANLYIDSSSPLITLLGLPVGYAISSSIDTCCKKLNNEKINQLSMFKHIKFDDNNEK